MTGSTTNAAFSEYIYFDGQRAARRDYQSNVFYYFADQVGSARGMAEVASGSHTATPCFDADFYPFGGEHDFLNSCPQNYKFMGKERDLETNNDEFGARSYASAYGRFLSADWSSTPSPVPYANLTNPQTLNLYAMVSDNPESFADLDGHFQNSQVGAGNQSDCVTSGSGSGSACASQPGQEEHHGSIWHFFHALGIVHTEAEKIQIDKDDERAAKLRQEYLERHPEVLLLAFGGAIGGGGEFLGEAEEAEAEFTAIEDVTKPGSSVGNLKVDLTPAEFSKNLEGAGYSRSTTQDGSVQFTKGDKTYTIYSTAKSTGKPTAQVKVGGQVVAKIRLNQ